MVIAIPFQPGWWMARTAGPGQANDEAPCTSFLQVTFDQLGVPVALRSPSRRIGHEDIPAGVRRYQGQTRRAERHHHSHWRSRTRAPDFGRGIGLCESCGQVLFGGPRFRPRQGSGSANDERFESRLVVIGAGTVDMALPDLRLTTWRRGMMRGEALHRSSSHLVGKGLARIRRVLLWGGEMAPEIAAA